MKTPPPSSEVSLEPPGSGQARTARRRVEFAALALAVIVLLIATFPHLGQSLDDAFITYRYARNLAEGHGLVFNPGEHHLGTTSPGWAMVLGALGSLTGTDAIPLASGVLSVLALVAALGLLAWNLAPRRTLPVLSLALLLAASCQWLIEVLGFEGFALGAVVLIALAAARAGHQVAAGVLWATAVLLRPDAGVLGAVAGLIEWHRSGRLPWRLALAFLASLAVGLATVWWLAGTLVPSSWSVKAAEGRDPIFARSLGYWRTLLQFAWSQWGWSGPLFAALALAGWWSALRARRRFALSVLALAVTNLVVYPALGVPFAPWYLIFPLEVMIVGAALAVAEAWSRGRVPISAAATAAVLAWMAPQVASAWRLGAAPPDGRMRHALAAAAAVSARAAPSDTVAAVEVGFLGFTLRQPVLDLMGLGSPGALEAMRTGRIADFVIERNPAFLVYNTNFRYLLGPLLDDPRFTARWRIVDTVPPDDRHLTSLEVYQRRSVESP